jgi:hypothetical protein
MQKKEKMFKNLLKGSLILFIALMLVLSTFLIIADMSPGSAGANYNGVRFSYNSNDGTFLFNMNNQQIRTHFHPLDAEPYMLSEQSATVLMNAPRIGVSQTKQNASELEPLAAFSLSEGLRKGRNAVIVPGYSDDEPLLDCDSAAQSYPIIMMRSADENNIEEQNNCIIIEYAEEAFLFVAKDTVLYHALGIMTP